MAQKDGEISVPVQEIDYSGLRKDMTAEALGRLLYQFKTSENICKLFNALFSEVQELQDTCVDVLDQRQLAKAVGAQLAVIGEIVGQDRSVTSLDFDLFGFDDDITALGFAEIIDDSVVGGGRFLEEGEEDSGVRELSDPEYRRFIIAKIFRNHFEWVTVNELAYIATLVLDSVEKTWVYKSGVGEISYFFHAPNGGLSQFDISIISIEKSDNKIEEQRIITAPAARSIGYYSYSVDELVFGFDDDTDSSTAGFGEEGDSEIGGTFAEELII